MEIIEFQDKGFENAVRHELGVTDEPLTSKDIAQLRGLLIYSAAEEYEQVPRAIVGAGFQVFKPNLRFNVRASVNKMWEADLKHFNRLKALYLYAKTTDLTFLSNFKELNELHVVGTRNKDWSFIAGLVNLRSLFIKRASFHDLEVFRELSITQEELASLSDDPFLWSHKLEFVRLEHCGIQDITPLADLKWLAELDLSHNQISDFSSVLDLPLYSLTLRYNRLSHLSFIARDRWHLDYLDVRHNQIEDISPLVYLINLSKLYVGHNPISDYSVIHQLPVQRHDVASYKPRRKRG